jgi:hypothetical protein
MQDSVGSELTKGSKVEAALYADGLGNGYLLVAVRGGSRPGSSSGDDPMAGWTKTESDGATCWSSPSTATGTADFSATMCMRGFWRRAVMVMGFSAYPLDASRVARAAGEAWDAQ